MPEKQMPTPDRPSYYEPLQSFDREGDPIPSRSDVNPEKEEAEDTSDPREPL